MTTEPPVSSNPGPVAIGRDGYLFLRSGAHDVAALCTGHQQVKPQSTTNFYKNLAARRDFCVARNITYRHVIFPEKMVALADWMQSADPIRSIFLRNYVDRHPEPAPDSLIFPLDVMRDQAAFFPKSDTHYSAAGYAAVAKQVLGSIDPSAPKIIDDTFAEVTALNANFIGDLGNKISPATTESIIQCSPLLRPTFNVASNGVLRGNDGLMILVETPTATRDETLLLFADSFFRQMLPLLTRVYRRIVFCRTRFLHTEIVDAIAPNVIMTGQAERYLSGCQPDTARPHFLSYAWASGKSMTPQEGFDALWGRLVSRPMLLPKEG